MAISLAAVGGHQHHRHARVPGADFFRQLEAVDLGHDQIGEQDIGGVAGLEPLERLAPIGNERHLVPLATQQPLDGRRERGTVLRHQDS